LEEQGDLQHETAEQMMSWNPYDQTKSSPFFDPVWMFGINEFDIVLGNPPYIGESGHKTLFAKYKQSLLGQCFYKGKMDLFYFFLHAGLNLLNEGGILAFITTNYYPTADGAAKLRLDLYARSNILKLINFNEYKIFESASGQHNMITLLQRTDSPKDGSVSQMFVKRKGSLTEKVIKDIFDGRDRDTVYATIPRKNLFEGKHLYIRFAASLSSLDNVLDKITSVGNPLETYFQTNQGVVPGAMVWTEKHSKQYPAIQAEKDEPIFVFPKGMLRKIAGIPRGQRADFIKPFFKNSDIHRFVTETKTNKELLYADGTQEIPSEIISYLQKFQPLLKSRREFQDGKRPWYELHRARKNGRNWYELHWAREESMFTCPKIVVPYRCERATFAYNDFPFYAATDVYYITEKDNNVTLLKALLGILNSRLIHTWLYHRGKRKGEMLELFPTSLQQIPLVMPKNLKALTDLVERRLAGEDMDAEIDALVYNLYGLTAEEITLIEGL
jgi:adenine-specific DNA-methyltransferase